ncbi:hypothetical protein D9B85_03745 [Corynebacterium diphtheriae]|nr:hypothetical protein D9B85_03745 [Corynebacterium diphtheriae]
MNGLFTNNEYSKATETCYHMRLKPLDSTTNNAYRRQVLDLSSQRWGLLIRSTAGPACSPVQ